MNGSIKREVCYSRDVHSSCRNSDFDLDPRLQTDARLSQWLVAENDFFFREKTHNLLDNLTGRMQVDEALVNLKFIAIPGLRTFTTRLDCKKKALEK